MTPRSPSPSHIAAEFTALAGKGVWERRVTEVAAACGSGQRTGRVMQQRFAVEVALARLHRTGKAQATAGSMVHLLAQELLETYRGLRGPGRERMRETLRAALSGSATLVPLFHLARAALLQRSRGFAVQYEGWAADAPFDLLLSRGEVAAELSCDVVSAEDGRDLHRGAWVRLVDRIDPDLQTWLAAHPGRYLLKMTLPSGLKDLPSDQGRLAALHARIRTLLTERRRADHDEAAVLRLDPLMLAGAQADELGLLAGLRREFGHEAHLAVTGGNGSVFVMAARAGREDEVAVAVRRRLAALAPTRLTGTRPGILAILVDDTDRTEWRHLRERLILEGEARRFLTSPAARGVVAVTCTSRLDLLTETGSDPVAEGELRFRNPSHPAARAPALAEAVESSV